MSVWVMSIMCAALSLHALTQPPPDTRAARADHATPSTSIQGSWLGVISAGGRAKRVGVIIDQLPDAGYTVKFRQLDPKVIELDVHSVAFDGTQLRFSLSKPNASYSGRLGGDPPRIAGVWSQRGMEFPLTFERTETLPGSTRPQEPLRPLPYSEEEIRVSTASKDVVLAGTLTKPKAEGKYPAFVLISGSGAQDRDESVFGHRPFLVLADLLTRRGFAVLRYDDRGVGGSSGDVYATTLDELGSEVLAWVEYLGSRADIDPDQIGLIGHSEGGLVAVITASRSPRVASIITLGTPAIPFREVRAMQTESLGRSLGASDTAIEGIRAFNRAVFDAVEAGQEGGALRDILAAEGERFIGSIPADEREHYEGLARDLVETGSGYATRWFRSLLTHDPLGTLAKVRCPVLALIGEKDVQVAAERNINAARAMLERHPGGLSKAIVLPSINHMLQTCRTGVLSEYVQIDETISPGVIAAIEAWHATLR